MCNTCLCISACVGACACSLGSQYTAMENLKNFKKLMLKKIPYSSPFFHEFRPCVLYFFQIYIIFNIQK